MGDLAFHIFLILFLSGLFGMFIGWCCRGVMESFRSKGRKATSPAVPAKKTARRKATVKAKNAIRKNSRPSKKDNLKLISGVGPALEAKLHKAGITQFRQIALWKKADIDKFDEVLDFKGRISREDWVKQAKILAKKNP